MPQPLFPKYSQNLFDASFVNQNFVCNYIYVQFVSKFFSVLLAKSCYFIWLGRFANVQGLPLPLELMPLTGWPETCHNINQHLPWTCYGVFVFQPSLIITSFAPKTHWEIKISGYGGNWRQCGMFCFRKLLRTVLWKTQFRKLPWFIRKASPPFFMMTSSNWNIFRVTGPLCGEFTACINGWVNNREAGNLKRHRAHYDVTHMLAH